MLKRTIDDQPTDEGQTYKEDPNNPDVLIREIKKHTELFRTLTETDVNQIKRLDEKRRSAFIFCELVKKEHHADVYWHPNPITIKNVEAATQRINAYLRSKRIKMANHTTELQGIFDTLHYFQQWSTSPVIFDKDNYSHNEKRLWRHRMQNVFDFEVQSGKYSGPFTNFYETNAIRGNNLTAFTFRLNIMWMNFKKMGIQTSFKDQENTLIDKVRAIAAIKDYEQKKREQKKLIDSMHTVVRHIFNTIGTDK